MSDAKFELITTEDLIVTGVCARDSRELMSPYVWREGNDYRLLIRAVPTADDQPSGRIWHGRSPDGLRFDMIDVPAIEPNLPHLDIGGCEDPTVVRHGERLVVFYTGVDEGGAAEMLWASGPDAGGLDKHGVAYHCSKTEKNTKEATVEIGDDGVWRLFFEYSRDDRSRIGLTFGRAADGPWDDADDPILPRDGQWDGHHLSTGPMIDDGANLTMFYNGATEDARWAIGWATFERDCRCLVGRCAEPLIAPPPGDGGEIAFASSALVEGDLVYLYYSINDRVPRRATLRRR